MARPEIVVTQRPLLVVGHMESRLDLDGGDLQSVIQSLPRNWIGECGR